MTNKELFRVANAIAGCLDDTQVLPGTNADTICLMPVEHTLRGALLERSSDPRAVYVNVFFQPLFIPASLIVLDFGWRLGGGARAWNIDAADMAIQVSEALREKAWSFLARIRNPGDVVDALDSLNRRDPTAERARAYALVKGGRTNDAARHLSEYLRVLDARVARQREELEIVQLFLNELQTDVAAAQRRLDSWQAETITKLALRSLCLGDT